MHSAVSFAERLRENLGQVVTARTFREIPASTSSHSLARLASRGDLIRVRRGHYYVPRESRFGPVPPDRMRVVLSTLEEERYLPGGMSAANALGFTTQLPMGRADVISTRGRRLLRGDLDGVRILERSPERRSLSEEENFFLELLRDIGHMSDLSPEATCERAVVLVRDGVVSLQRMFRAAREEPPRVRAMLGAIGTAAGTDPAVLVSYRELINPGSRYKFGPLGHLSTARGWGAR